jgi:TolB-like protein
MRLAPRLSVALAMPGKLRVPGFVEAPPMSRFDSIFALVVLWAAACGAGLAAELTIGILPLQKAPKVPADAALTIEQFLYSELASQQRFRVVERTRIDALVAERSYQADADVVNPSALRDLGAEYVVTGEVTRTDIARSSQDGITSYHATVAFGIRVIEVSTGAVIGSEEFSSARGNPFSNLIRVATSSNATPAGALDIALQKSRKQFNTFLAGVFPASGQVVMIEGVDRKGIPAQVLISLGVADGMNAKSKMVAYVVEVLAIDGRDLQRKAPIAELNFLQGQGEHLTLVTVRKGGEKLKAALDANEKVIVEFVN